MKHRKQIYILKELLKKAKIKITDDFYIAGGACTSVFSRSKVNDLDIYF